MKKTEQLTRVRLDELSLYLQTIYQQYGKKTNQEYYPYITHKGVEYQIVDISVMPPATGAAHVGTPP